MLLLEYSNNILKVFPAIVLEFSIKELLDCLFYFVFKLK